MKIMGLLIALSLVLAVSFLFAFYKAIKKGQFEDLESPGFRILDKKSSKNTTNK